MVKTSEPGEVPSGDFLKIPLLGDNVWAAHRENERAGSEKRGPPFKDSRRGSNASGSQDGATGWAEKPKAQVSHGDQDCIGILSEFRFQQFYVMGKLTRRFEGSRGGFFKEGVEGSVGGSSGVDVAVPAIARSNALFQEEGLNKPLPEPGYRPATFVGFARWEVPNEYDFVPRRFRHRKCCNDLVDGNE